MFGVSLPNTEHQLAFLHYHYRQLQQENMFYQTCIKNQQQQLEELKAKEIPCTPAEKKNRRISLAAKKNQRTSLAAKNNNVSASELQKTPPTLKPYFELKHSERAHRNIYFLKWHHLYIVTLHQLKLSLSFTMERRNTSTRGHQHQMTTLS